jgi:putative transposase
MQPLERVCGQIGYSNTIRVSNVSEFISRDLDLWAFANDATLGFSRPGNSAVNGFIAAFSSKLKADCLNAHCFMSLADPREKLETWRRYYNEERPHSAIGYNLTIAMHHPDDLTSTPRETSRKSTDSGGPRLGKGAPTRRLSL